MRLCPAVGLSCPRPKSPRSHPGPRSKRGKAVKIVVQLTCRVTLNLYQFVLAGQILTLNCVAVSVPLFTLILCQLAILVEDAPVFWRLLLS